MTTEYRHIQLILNHTISIEKYTDFPQIPSPTSPANEKNTFPITHFTRAPLCVGFFLPCPNIKTQCCRPGKGTGANPAGLTRAATLIGCNVIADGAWAHYCVLAVCTCHGTREIPVFFLTVLYYAYYTIKGENSTSDSHLP